MGTLADLRARIISETNRDDLVDDMAAALDQVIQASVAQYADELWWFNEIPLTTVCTVGSPYAQIPSGVYRIDDLWVIVGAVRYPLRRLPWAHIESLYTVPSIGQPTDYAEVNGQIYMWPTASQPWPLLWNVIADVLPALDFTDPTGASSNIWTNEGQDLITAQSKIRLYRDYLSAVATDPRIVQATTQEADAYSNLRSRSNRRTSSGRVAAGW
jgi:hypothetical protein